MENTHVYCKHCEAIRPMYTEPPGDEDVTGRFTGASDILCVVCGHIIATTYRPNFSPREVLRELMRRM